jgi:YHS domain-containing protein/thioredoxin-related protein
MMMQTQSRFGVGWVTAVGVLLALSCRAEAAHVSWHKDFQQAAQESIRSGKPMLVKFTAVWCGYCQKMKQSFADKSVSQHLNTCFVPVIIDADSNQRLVNAIGIEGLPTTVIISPDLKVLTKIVGYKTPRELDRYLIKVCNHQEKDEPRVRKTTARPAKAVAVNYAFERICLVSLRDERELKQGSIRYTTFYKGATICFATEAHRRRFQAAPEEYWPALDGSCPVIAVEQNVQRKGELHLGAIYRDRLWFFSTAENRLKFANAPRNYVPIRSARKDHGEY